MYIYIYILFSIIILIILLPNIQLKISWLGTEKKNVKKKQHNNF